MIGISRQRLTVFRIIQMALGFVLLTAAALKGYQLATESVLDTGLLHWRPLQLAAVEFELFLGLWLISGAFARASWWTTLVCFGVFSAASVFKALSGDGSCGCFGKVTVSPWYTLLLDLAIVGCLLRWRPELSESRSVLSSSVFRIRFVGVLVVWLTVGIVTGVTVERYQPARLAEGGEIVGDDEFVLLEPETWIDKRFALAEQIDVGATLSNGLWLVLLYDHRCSACREAVSEYEGLARDFDGLSDCPGIAIIEILPYAEQAIVPGDVRSVHGRLGDTNRWKVRTPVSLLLDEGMVRNVFENPRDTGLIRAIWGQQ